MALCKLLTVVVLIYNAEGLLGAEVRSSIVGGHDAPLNKWPWMVHVNVSSDGGKKWRCGGTIIGDEWVLTAASCWNREGGADPARSMVWVGSHSLQKPSSRYMAIIDVIIHPNYENVGSGYQSDLALLKLKKKIVKVPRVVELVTLPSTFDTFDPSNECWIIGWGYIRANVPLPDPETLQQLRISIMPQSVCSAKYPEVASDILCAGDKAGGKDACIGDYGGPLMCRAGSGYVQAGIMSFGSCGLPGVPGVYTKVSSFVDFINRRIGGKEASAEV
ncbi:tryptase-2-like [Symphorus nematophorus]